MNINSFLSLPNEQILPIFEKLSLRDLLNCEEACHYLDDTITLLFEHNHDFQNIFEQKDHVFSINCSNEELKTRLAADKRFFKSPFFEEFIWNQFADEIFPACLNGLKTSFNWSETYLTLFQECRFTAHLAKRFASEYLNSANKNEMIQNLCKFIENTDIKQMASFLVSLEEHIVDAIFKEHLEQLIASLKKDILSLGFESVKHDLENFDPLYILEDENLKAIKVLDQELEFIGNDKARPLLLKTPYITLEKRVQTEVYKALCQLVLELKPQPILKS